MDAAISRRAFAKTGLSTALGATALPSSRAAGANDRIRLGVIGTGNRGRQVMEFFLKQTDCEIVAVSDVSRSTMEEANAKWLGGKAAAHGDFRTLLDRRDIDAVLIATPDHWHALQTIMACRAGKDVYCEKPLSKTIREGRKMVEVARQAGRVVQVGTHRRSGNSYADAARRIASGKIGKVTVARAYDTTNMYPQGIGKAAPGDPPKGCSYNMMFVVW
jgi:predicted dehydrogenase